MDERRRPLEFKMAECPKNTTPFYSLQSTVNLLSNEDDGTLRMYHLKLEGDLYANDYGGLESVESGV